MDLGQKQNPHLSSQQGHLARLAGEDNSSQGEAKAMPNSTEVETTEVDENRTDLATQHPGEVSENSSGPGVGEGIFPEHIEAGRARRLRCRAVVARDVLRQIVLFSVLGPAVVGATTYPIGPSRAYSSPCQLVANVALMPGDVLEVDAATYHDACQLTASGTSAAPIVLRGASGTRPVFDATGLDLSGSGSVPRAIFQFTGGSFWVVQHLELENATNGSLNGAAFRLTAGSHDIVIEDVSVHDCQDGFMSDGVATLTVRSSDVFHNGAGDGYSHNFYLQGQTSVLVGNHIHDSNGGQNVKIRSHDAALLYNRIENAGNYEVDLIQGPLTSLADANAVLIGNVIIRPASSGNDSQVILWGTDNASEAARDGSLYVINNTVVLANGSNRLFHAIQPAAGSQIILDNNIVFATVAGAGMAADSTTAGILVGSHNWVGSNIAQAGALTNTLTGASPGFVGAADLHLTAGSPAINAGLGGLTYMDGTGSAESAVPTLEFATPFGTVSRPGDGQLDLGAYEFASAASPDSGSPDGGVADGGAPGAGPPDGGGPAGGPALNPVTSGCSVTGSAPVLWLLPALVALGARRSRARSRR
jgi:hypothetical protein